MSVSSAVLIDMILQNKEDLLELTKRSDDYYDRWKIAKAALEIERRRRRQNQGELSEEHYRRLRVRCDFYKPHYRMLEDRRYDLKKAIRNLEIDLNTRTTIRVRSLEGLEVVKGIYDRLEWMGQIRNEGEDQESYEQIRDWAKKTEYIELL